MAVITSIKQQKNKNRVNVYLDEEFGFGIDLDNFVILNLKIGQELSQDEVDKVIKTSEFQKTLDKLFRFAMVRFRSQKEYEDYLKRKKVSEVIWKDLLSKLKDLDFIDDERFAKEWVYSRNNFRPKPKRILEQELSIKGIDRNIIKKVIDETVIDENIIALNLLKSRESYWERIEKVKREQKMIEYLVRKGFSFEVAKNAIKVYNKAWRWQS